MTRKERRGKKEKGKNDNLYTTNNIHINLYKMEFLISQIGTDYYTLDLEKEYNYYGLIDKGYYSIHKLVFFPELLKEYIDRNKKENLNVTTLTLNNTPLMLAAYSNILESVKLLLSYNVDLNIRQTYDHRKTALMISIDDYNCFSLIIKNGADITIKNEYNENILDLIIYRYIELSMFFNGPDIAKILTDIEKNIKLLLQYGIDIINSNVYQHLDIIDYFIPYILTNNKRYTLILNSDERIRKRTISVLCNKNKQLKRIL